MCIQGFYGSSLFLHFSDLVIAKCQQTQIAHRAVRLGHFSDSRLNRSQYIIRSNKGRVNGFTRDTTIFGFFQLEYFGGLGFYVHKIELAGFDRL